MKKIARFVTLVFLFQVWVGCEKKGSSVEVIEQNNSEVVSSETATVSQANVTQETQSATTNSKALQIVETVVPPYTELKEDALISIDIQNIILSDFGWTLNKKRIPYYVFDETSCFKNYHDKEKDQIDYITNEYPATMITNCDRNKKTIEGYQIITTPNNRELKYNFLWQYYDEINDYAYTYYTLENITDFFSIPKPTQQPKVDLLEMNEDSNMEHLKLAFNEYINNVYDEEVVKVIENLNDSPLRVINYLKGNFVNSGYDEYLVFFNRGMQFTNEFSSDYMNYIELGACIVLKDDIIIRSYLLPNINGVLDFAWYYRQDNKIKPKRQDFAARFIQGWVGDFNKNGINEIIIEDLGSFGTTDIFVLEFTDDQFRSKLLMDFTGRIDTLTYDWENENFTCEYGFTQHVMFDKTYRAIIKWSEKENCYIRVSNEQI